MAVEAKNSLDSASCKDAQPNNFVKPPANLVVLEGDCLDATGDGSELESYLVLFAVFIFLLPMPLSIKCTLFSFGLVISSFGFAVSHQ